MLLKINVSVIIMKKFSFDRLGESVWTKTFVKVL